MSMKERKKRRKQGPKDSYRAARSFDSFLYILSLVPRYMHAYCLASSASSSPPSRPLRRQRRLRLDHIGHRPERPAPFAIQHQQVVVVPPQGAVVGDGEKGDPQRAAAGVEVVLFVVCCVVGGEAVGVTAHLRHNTDISLHPSIRAPHHIVGDGQGSPSPSYPTRAFVHLHTERQTQREKIEERTSTSLETAEVHSSKIANCGLCCVKSVCMCVYV